MKAQEALEADGVIQIVIVNDTLLRVMEEWLGQRFLQVPPRHFTPSGTAT